MLSITLVVTHMNVLRLLSALTGSLKYVFRSSFHCKEGKVFYNDVLWTLRLSLTIVMFTVRLYYAPSVFLNSFNDTSHLITVAFLHTIEPNSNER